MPTRQGFQVEFRLFSAWAHLGHLGHSAVQAGSCHMVGVRYPLCFPLIFLGSQAIDKALLTIRFSDISFCGLI